MSKFKYESINYSKDHYGEWERNGLSLSLSRTHFIAWMVQQGYELFGTTHDPSTDTLTDTFKLVEG